VGTGGRVLAQQVSAGRVLFLALEDSPRRLKERMTRQAMPANASVAFVTEWSPFAEGGLADLQAEIERDGYRLVIVDTFSRALGRADQQDMADMTAILGNLQQAAMLRDVAILLIDHHRKPAGFMSDPIDDILGSTAKAAVADASLGLYREQGKHGATLKITGRDIEEQELALEWDALTCCWQSLGIASEVRADSVKSEIVQAIEDLTEIGEPATTAAIADHINKDRGNVSHALADLVAENAVIKLTRQGRVQPYGIPTHMYNNNNNTHNDSNDHNTQSSFLDPPDDCLL
jgi:hypothetical protein